MKALPPPEDEVDPDGAPTTIVADSDDEHEEPVPVVAPVVAPVTTVKVVEEPVVEVVEEVKPKKKIVRKKTDA